MRRKQLKTVRVSLAVLLAMASLGGGGSVRGGVATQGLMSQGLMSQGLMSQGLMSQGLMSQGLMSQGLMSQGLMSQGLMSQGLMSQGLMSQGLMSQGGLAGDQMEQEGVDRVRALFSPILLGPVQRVNVPPAPGFQGIQTGTPVDFTAVQNPMYGVQLQAGPSDVNPGSFIYVPGPSGALDLTGTLWNQPLLDVCSTNADCPSPGSCSNGACTQPSSFVTYYVAAVEKDTQANSSKYASNDDVFLYTVYYRQPGTGRWASLCPLDGQGKARALAIPLDYQDWASGQSRSAISFACTGSGVAAKCARSWGYKPWKTVTETIWNGTSFVPVSVPLAPFYDACLVAARADYCQDGNSYTHNGTTVDMFDTLDGFTSINSTVGLPYAPYSSGIMLHEEYQISALDLGTLSSTPAPFHVSENYTQDELMSLPADTQTLVSTLRRSGMESSRYADLDPGRSCAAGPYIDRCDPKEPYGCYRAANMSSQPYGAFLAINSPRFCGHDEATPGDPLDPLCNECINRVCQIDPTCCGDPGSTYYPGSLVWDSRCSAIRQDVCKSGPGQPVWPAGVTAVPASAHSYVYLNGAVGSLEGITTSGGTSYAEGWACDPDFPGASSPVQISVGGVLGATGASLLTATADQPLISGWNEAAAAACGGQGRHGFRVALPAGSAGMDVYVYGIDMNVPGAPYSLLRGGKKTVPGGAASPAAQAAIWTGWIEPTATDDYAFAVDVGPSDLYRVWINGLYVAGNWVDSDPSVPGAFTLPPPGSPPVQHLLAGVQYGVRVEYRRPDPSAAGYASSRFSLLWSAGGAGAVAVPPANLVATAQRSGTGLLTTFYQGYLDYGTQMPGQPIAAVDYVWTADSPPASSLSVNQQFSATFVGQVVPPVSGDYTFTADTDGDVQITVNGQVVTKQAAAPAIDTATCSHDICRTGAAVSRTCSQGYFCSAQICAADPSCCSITWDANCVQEVKDVCFLDCSPTPPIPITLSAGIKYDISVTYVHQAGGATMHLMWALPGAPRDVIPAQRLFAAVPPSGTGVGINAAYFSDATFETEYLDIVQASLAYDAAVAPGPALATTMVCGIAGAPACAGSAAGLGAPGLSTPVSGASVAGPSVALSGGGVAGGATVDVAEGNLNGDTFVPATIIDSFTPSPNGGGLFTRTLTLAVGAHTIAARQSLAGQTSPWSAALALSVVPAADPQAPAAPVFNQPPAGFVSGNGTVAVGGTAAPGATVTVAAGTTTQTFVADGTGAWSGLFVLPAPGDYNLAVTQTSGGHTSLATAPVDVKVALPVLSLSSPADGATVSSPVAIAGGGAQASLGGVIAGDGDGRYFAERKTLSVGGDGSFADTVALDYGRHVLKVFQRANGLDGDGITRTVLVPPPAPSPGITLVVSNGNVYGIPASGPVGSTVTLSGAGTLRRTGATGTGLRPMIYIYQGTSKIGETPMADDGTFAITLTIPGSGAQSISVSQVAYSLSGGGAAEGPRTTPITLVVTPPAPAITQPVTGTQLSAPPVVVSGRGVVGATVEIFVDGSGTPAASTTVDGTGAFSTSVSVSAGSRRLAASQTKDGATSPLGAPITVTVGDVTPPTLVATQQEVTVVGTDPAGSTIPAGTYVTITSPDGLPNTLKCVPSLTGVFPYGTTLVGCTASDAAGNVGKTVFRVTVRSNTPPDMPPDQVLSFQAAGPQGAIADYRISATGFVADCSVPGSGQTTACTQWTPAGKGLGFSPTSIAIDPTDGTLYAGTITNDDYAKPVGSRYFKSTDHGTTWQEVPFASGFLSNEEMNPEELAVGPASLLVAGTSGLHITPDVGASWSLALSGSNLSSVATDPGHPQHMVTYSRWFAGGQAFETLDGWVSSHPVPVPDDGFQTLVIDPTELGRMYAVGTYFAWDNDYYRRVAGGGWERMAVPPYLPVRGIGYTAAEVAAVSPVAEVCDPGQPACQPCAGNPGQLCQIHPTVFLGPVLSRDGGDTWQLTLGPQSDVNNLKDVTSILFDRDDPRTIYAGIDDGGRISHDGGRTWAPISLGDIGVRQILQDPIDHNVIYTLRAYAGWASGLFRSTDRGLTWTRVGAPQLTLEGSHIHDVAVDPVDPNVAYVISDTNGVMKTTDGGQSWNPANNGISSNDWALPSKLLINPLERNTIYLGGYTYLYRSSDSGASWAKIGGGGCWTMAIDPLTGTFYGTAQAQESSNTFTNIFTLAPGDTTRSYFQVAVQPSFAGEYINPYDLTIIPDARRTVILSWYDGDPFWGVKREIFSGLEAQAGGFSLVNTTHDYSWGDFYVTYDRSDGVDRFYVSGQRAEANQNETGLYRSAGTDPAAPGWTRVGGLASGELFSDFNRLLIDSRSGGRVMTTLSLPDTGFTYEGEVFDSQDGGQTWHTDNGTPGQVTWLWGSRADSALYATVNGFGAALPDSNRWNENPGTFEIGAGTLWKRSVARGTPPGARIVRGDVPVTCTGGDGTQPVTPGSVFPLGDTVLVCTATDAFGNSTSRNVTIRVGDTQPPVMALQSSTDSVLGTLIYAGPTNVSYTVAATDAVDGDRPVSCTPGSGTLFTAPATTVTCTASDRAGNAAQLSFTVTIASFGGTQTPAISPLPDLTVTATGPGGGVATWTATARTVPDGAPLTPSCSPASGSTFPLGRTTVTCTASAGAATATTSFNVTVADKTPPVITPPAPIAVDAQGAWGASVTYAATASDAVDGTVTPVCTPASAGIFPPGLSTVTCTATDAAGNVATALFQVTVNLPAGATPGNPSAPDLTPPVLTLPADMTVGAQDQLGATVTYSASAVDSGNPVSVDCVPPSNTLFPLGDTTVNCMAADAGGNIAQGAFVVHVVDQDAPTVSGPANQTVEATGPGGAPVSFTASASDYVSGVLSPVCARTSGGGVPVPVVSGATFPMGDSQVTCTATDAQGNVGSASFTVTVRDTTPPLLTLPAAITQAAGATGSVAVMYAPTATDLVAGPLPVSCTPKSGSYFVVGTTPVACAARDAAGNTATGVFTVTVTVANAPPVVTVPAPMVVEASSAAGAIVTFTASATDAQDGPRPVTCTPAAGSTFALGTTPVTCTATDTQGATGSASFTVTVSDTTPPALTLPANITMTAGAHNQATVTFTASATDAVSGTLAPTCTPASGTVFSVGTTTVSCSVQDAAHNAATGTFTVTILNTPPVVTVPSPIVAEATSASGAPVTFTATANDTQDGALAPTCTPASGSTFPLGSKAVTCTATDSKGATGSATFTVTVRDTTAPKLTLPAPITVTTTGATAVVTFNATATDLVSGAIAPACTPVSGSAFTVGTTTVNCSATDAAQNVATGSFTVTVVGANTPPVVTVPAPMTVEATSASGAVVSFTASATDAQDGARPVTCTPASGSTFALATTTVTCKATDLQGATGSASFTVTVRDTTSPRLTLPGNLTATAGSNGTAVVTFSATATDLVSGSVAVACNPASGAAFPTGTTTVSCSAADAAGNKSSGSFTVTVTAPKPLVLTVPADVTISVCANANIGTATATGGVAPVTITSNKPATFALGTTTVTYTAKDASGKTVNGTQKVTAVLGDDASCCPAGTKVIKGTAGNDVINGTSGSDCILGLGGDDVINGGGGNDVISGGAGNDVINCAGGNDVIYGGDGNDVINGGAGNDTISGGAGNDVISGGDGDDVIDGGDGTDTCSGGGGKNTLTTCEVAK